MDGPLLDLLPEEGNHFVGWPLFLLCLICLTFEKTQETSIWAVGLTYAASKDWIHTYSMMALIPIMIILLQTVSHMLLTILSTRQIATLLSASAVGLVLATTLGGHDNSFLVIAQFCFMIASSFFIEPVICSMMLLIFNEEWKARMYAFFLICRNCSMMGGVYAVTAAYEFEDQLLMPILMGLTVLCYLSFLVASYSFPSENVVDKSISSLPFYSTLDINNQ